MLGLLVAIACFQDLYTPADGTLIVLNKGEGSASLIDLKTGKVRQILHVGDSPHEAATSPDGNLIAISNYGAQEPGSTITVVDMRGPRVAKTLSLGEYKRPHGLYWLDKDKLLVTCETNEALLVLNVATEKIEKVFRTGQQVSHMVVATPDRRYAFTANIGSGSVSVIDLVEGKHVKVIPTGAGAEGIDISPNGREVWVANRGANTLSVIEVRSLKVMKNIECASFPIRVKFTPDGHYALVSNARSGDLAIFDAESKREVRRLALKADPKPSEGRTFGAQFGGSSVPIGLLPHPKGRWVYVALSNADMVAVVDLLSGKVSAHLIAGKEPDGLAFSPLSASPTSEVQPPLTPRTRDVIQ
jgi:YVTN family beta-propeller protein